MIDLEKLKAKAELAATASHTDKWRYEKMGQTVWGHGIGGGTMQPGDFMVADIRGWGHLQYLPNGAALQDATGEFIAAANPSVVLELLKIAQKYKFLTEELIQFYPSNYNGNPKSRFDFYTEDETGDLDAYIKRMIEATKYE